LGFVCRFLIKLVVAVAAIHSDRRTVRKKNHKRFAFANTYRYQVKGHDH
jgi:hypothetical protein